MRALSPKTSILSAIKWMKKKTRKRKNYENEKRYGTLLKVTMQLGKRKEKAKKEPGKRKQKAGIYR